MSTLLETRLQEHFGDLQKQFHAARLGMWTFIASELMLFTALFGLYAGYRAAFGEGFAAGVKHNAVWLGTANTVILLTSSLFVALAVHATRGGSPRGTALWLGAAVLLGAVFLGLKSYEYVDHLRHGIAPGNVRLPPEEMRDGLNVFFALYYLTTGLHGLHVVGGMAILAWLAWGARRGCFRPEAHTALELGGMYWHFVDVVWLYLWPMFYLMG